MHLSPVYLLVDHTAGHKTLGGFTTRAAARAANGVVAPGHNGPSSRCVAAPGRWPFHRIVASY